ncbi:MAG: hypothetical protein WA160_02700 [Pseudobdellovibrio sp.]
MNILNTFFILFFSSVSWGWGYEYKPISKYNGLDLYEIASELKKASLFEVDLVRAGHIPFAAFDQLFLNSKHEEQFAVVVFDLIAPNEQTILSLEEDKIVCHAKTQMGRDFAIYFSNRKMSESISYCRKTKVTSTFKKMILKQIFPPAQAANCEVLASQISTNLVEVRNTVLAGKEWVLQKLGTCLIQAYRGGVSAANGFGDGLKSLVSNPEHLWDEVSEQALAFKNFVTHIGAEARILIENFKNLDSDLILNTLCNMSGEILISGLLTSGALGIAAKITSAVVKLTAQLKIVKATFSHLSELKKMGRVDLANGILSCEK